MTKLTTGLAKLGDATGSCGVLTVEEAAAVADYVREIKATVQEVEWKLTPEYLKEGDEEYIRCYIMPSGVWHLLLGTVRQ